MTINQKQLEGISNQYLTEFDRAYKLLGEQEVNLACEAFRTCIEFAKELQVHEPNNAVYFRWQAISYASLAEALAQTDARDEMLDAYKSALSLFEVIWHKAGFSVAAISDLAQACCSFVDIALDIEDIDSARPVIEILLALLQSKEFNSDVKEHESFEAKAKVHSSIGRFLKATHCNLDAAMHYLKGSELMERALRTHPEDETLRCNVAISWLQLALSDPGTESIKWLEKSYQSLKDMQMRIELPPQAEHALNEVRYALGWRQLHGRGG